MERIYRLVTGDGDTIDYYEDEEDAIDARVRWMDEYPGTVVEVYERVE